MKLRAKSAAAAVGAAIGLSLLSPIAPAQALGGVPVQNSCAGTGGPILGYRQVSGNVQLVPLNCGQTGSDLFKVSGGTFRVQKTNSSFSVCYSNTTAAVSYTSRAWTVSSC